jgi:hypothetical protein
MEHANSRIPVKPLDYSQRNIAQEKELLIDYTTGNIYIVRTINEQKTIIDVTKKIADSVGTIAHVDGNAIITIDGIGDVELSATLLDLINSSVKMNDVVDHTKLIKKAITDKSGNQYAPVTIADAVYTSDGGLVEEKLKNITRLGMVVVEVDITDEDLTFTIPFPFNNYLENGNHMIVFLDSNFMSESKYTVNGTSLTILGIEPIAIRLYKKLVFVFLYNSTTAVIGTSQFDGSFITKGSIETSKLKNTSNSISLDDSSYLATSKAIKMVYDSLTNRINIVDPDNAPKSVLVYGTSDILTLTYPGDISLVDRLLLNVKVQVDVNTGAILRLNGIDVPLYI